MVISIINGFKYESYWGSKNNNTNKPLKPREGKPWQNQKLFIHKLIRSQQYLKHIKQFKKYDEPKDCLICGKKSITTGLLQLNKWRWEDGLIHYIEKHSIKPSEQFIDTLFRHEIGASFNKNKAESVYRIHSKAVVSDNKQYLKLDRNQIFIMDALMKHGEAKRYHDATGSHTVYRYSEHYGILDFDEHGLDKIIISARTNRVEATDDEIYFPTDMEDVFDYEYIFHTHPPTPRPGGRADQGILYEFPSINDLFHFTDKYNKGTAQGSIVVAAEGMYIIRKHLFDNKPLKYDEDLLYKKAQRAFIELQNKAVDTYGSNFGSYEFYSKIAQDRSYIDKFNTTINKFDLHIEYYPRIRDSAGHWIIDTIYLPVFAVEPAK